ncbi:hypothetical protein OEB99_03070 [Actinotalea sp. M2MS4P-6]|uniref:hypothetical protein n=1 Tax=Actinotalea sp. M2MS4P-6 TaxID=2983762 RepID=UPI0021E37FB1|nr:hypothetical protein [Actinotalea sp. M2MS4P-6]MCV2393279.1 hypothetical protein [Actinotalea sp. M2MS4P-6]
MKPTIRQKVGAGALTAVLGVAGLLAAAPAQAVTAPPSYVSHQLALRTGTGAVTVYDTSGVTTGLSQTLVSDNSCALTATGSALLGFSAVPGGSAYVGYRAGGLGVRESLTANGQSCAMVDFSSGESITVQLGSALSGYVFTAAALDVELKHDASVAATAYLGTTAVGTFTLDSGSSSSGVTCNALADSGPDAGTLDHCRWDISGGTSGVPMMFDSLTLTATAGSFSLDGGSDGAVPVDTWAGFASPETSSFFDLAPVIDCGETATLPSSGKVLTSSWKRYDDLASGGLCEPYPYSASTGVSSTGTPYAEFLKPADTETAQAVWTTTFVIPTGKLPTPTLDFGSGPVALAACPDGLYSGGVINQSLVPTTDLDAGVAGQQYGCVISASKTNAYAPLKAATFTIYLLGDVRLSF